MMIGKKAWVKIKRTSSTDCQVAMSKVQLDCNRRVHLIQPEKSKEDTLTNVVLAIQEAIFKVQLDRDGKMYI